MIRRKRLGWILLAAVVSLLITIPTMGQTRFVFSKSVSFIASTSNLNARQAGGPDSHDHAARPGQIDVSKLPRFEGASEYRVTPSPYGSGIRGGNTGDNFRTRCEFSHFAYDDPIVFPNQPGASHLHLFFGNTETNAFSTPETIRHTGNSTCSGGIANRTAYWVPALLDSTGTPVVPKTAIWYYKGGYEVPRETIKAFPAGLRMIAGDATATEQQDPGKVQFWCDGAGEEARNGIPICPQGKELMGVIRFPQCWDGQHLDSPDHKSHMAYPENGNCPASHPQAIPVISLNIHFPVNEPDTRGWKLDSDRYDTAAKPGGYSWHGDWFNGWEQPVVETFVRECINKSNDCGVDNLGDGTWLKPLNE